MTLKNPGVSRSTEVSSRTAELPKTGGRAVYAPPDSLSPTHPPPSVVTQSIHTVSQLTLMLLLYFEFVCDPEGTDKTDFQVTGIDG